MFAASTILYKMIVCLSESRGGLRLGNLFLATVDNAIKIVPEQSGLKSRIRARKAAGNR
jgi:hypothetical protein